MILNSTDTLVNQQFLKIVITAQILGGDGYTLYMQAIDGNVFQCYHNNIDFIWDK